MTHDPREKIDCPLCDTPKAFTPPLWPGFYEAGRDHILWVDASGRVANGDWRPTFSEDRLTCWADPRGAVFTWVGPAPGSGKYNDVIEKFRQERLDTENTKPSP